MSRKDVSSDNCNLKNVTIMWQSLSVYPETFVDFFRLLSASVQGSCSGASPKTLRNSCKVRLAVCSYVTDFGRNVSGLTLGTAIAAGSRASAPGAARLCDGRARARHRGSGALIATARSRAHAFETTNGLAEWRPGVSSLVPRSHSGSTTDPDQRALTGHCL